MNEDGIPEDLADAVEAAFVSVVAQARASAVAAIRARSSTLVAAAGTDHVAQPDAVFNIDEWMERVNAEVGPTIEKVLIDSANQAGIGVSLDLADPRMAAAAVRHVEGIASWGQNFRQTVAKVIEEGMAKGWSVDRMADKLAETGSLTDASARRIARTEAIAAANAGTIEGWKLLGFVTGKRWLATPDEKTRDTHAAADGQEVPIDGRFTIGDGTADYPGDPALPVGERVNCRCRMLSIDDGADAAKPEPQDTTVTMPAKSSIRLPQPPPGTPTVDDGGWRTTADRAVHARSLWSESPTVRHKIVDVQANLVRGRAPDHAVDFVDVVMELASDPTITIDSISQRWWQQPETIRDHVVAAADELLGQLDEAPAVNRRLYAPVDPRWLAGALLVGATIAMPPSEWTDTDDGDGVVAMDPPVDAVEVVPGSYLWAGAVQVTGIDRDRSRLSVRPLDRSRTLVATAAKADVYARPVDTDDDRTLIGRVEFANPNHDERGRFARKDEGRRVPTKGVDGHSGGGIPDKVSLKAPSDVKVQNIRVSDIEPENNDRTEFKGIEELGESIKEHGLAQPITVRPRPAHMGEGPPYVIVAGERRWRAHQHIGAEEIPAIVRDLTDEEASGVMLVENLARVDINPMDEAMAYADRMEKFGYTVEEVAKIAGVKPHRVKTYLPLLKLAPELQDLVKKGSLAMGIGYELVGQNGVVLDSDRQMAAFKAFQSEGLSMAQVRHVVARLVDAQSQDSMFDSNDFMQVEEWTREAKAKKVSKKTLMKTFGQVVEELAKHDPKNPLVTQARMMLNPDDEAVAASAAVVDETMLADGVDIDDDWYDRLRMLRRLTVALAGYGPSPAVDAATGILNPGQDPATTFATMKARLYAQFANPNHDERGRFARKDEGRRVPTKGIDGHSGIPDKVSLSGTLTPDQISQILGQPGPGIPVDSAAEAIEHLLNGRKVELPTRREVAVLLDELRDLVTEAKTAGEKAPEFNLCGVTLKGSSLFCEENHGIPRVEMPQLSGRPLPGSPADALPRDDQGNVNLADKFRDHLAGKGVKITDDAIPASMLKATQNELQGTKVANIAVKVEAGKMPPARLFVSNDNYIVDGHHRWAATIGADYRDDRDDLMPVDVAVVDMGILELLVEANHFADDWGIPQASMIGSSAQGPPPKPDGPHRATQFANPYHDVDDGRFTRAGEGRVVPTRGLGPHSNVEWGPKRLDTPVEDYGMTYDHAAASSPDVVWAKTWGGWDDQPVVDLPLGGELIATEKLLVSQSVAKYGYEPVPDGYEARVMIDDQDRMVIVDGHHRFAHMRVQGAKTIPVRILTRAVRAAAHQTPRLVAATVKADAQFANPNHDELGRFARKGEGRAVPTKGIPDKTSIATRAATKIGSAVERLHAWKPGYPFDTDGIPGPLKSGALDWIHYRRLLPIRAAAASITGIESTDPSPAQPTQPSQRQRDQAAALLEAIAASPPKTVQRGLHLSASDADAMLEAGGIADAMATSTTVDWIAENFALGLYRTSRAGGPTVGVLVTYRNTRALPITPIYVGEGKGGVSHLLASADEHLISGRFRFDPASVRTETLQGARVIHVDAYPEEEAAAVAASGGVTIDGFFVPPYGCDGGSITGALASADASTEFTAAHQFRNPYKDELGRFTTPEGDADGVEDIEIDHDPDFPVKEGFKRVFTHSARLRAAKERGVSIPPGWRNTQVSKDPDAPGLRARGVDAAGRVQPRYSRDHIESASAEKYQRILSFQTRYAERLDDHLREDAETDPTAGAVVLMRRMGLRPGSTADTRAKVQAYGATTLEARHIKFLDDGKTVKLDFTGKKGVRIQLSTKDKLVYRTLLAHTAGKKPGERIFQTTSDRTNAYLARVLHDAPTFTNKDLRTILGTGYARRMTRRMPIPRTAAENRRARKKVAERVARILGNEPGEALRSYIAPEVFDAAGW